MATVNEEDADGDTALDIILMRKYKTVIDSDAVVLLLEASLPFDPVTGEPLPNQEHKYGWGSAVQSDDALVVDAVETVLDKYPHRISDFTNATDSKGRCCLDIASSTCRELMLKRLYLHGRFEVKRGPPEHRSRTSVVYFAVDHTDLLREDIHRRYSGFSQDKEKKGENNCPTVALKFMKNRDQYEREVGIRSKCDFDSRYVLSCVKDYDGDSQVPDNVNFRTDAVLKGYGEYPYCVVMEAGTMSLKQLVDKQNIAGEDWDAVRNLTRQLAKAVDHIHRRGVIHGDLKGKSM